MASICIMFHNIYCLESYGERVRYTFRLNIYEPKIHFGSFVNSFEKDKLNAKAFCLDIIYGFCARRKKQERREVETTHYGEITWSHAVVSACLSQAENHNFRTLQGVISVWLSNFWRNSYTKIAFVWCSKLQNLLFIFMWTNNKKRSNYR